MALAQEHQWMLLKDILHTHQEDCCGSQAECEQLERTIINLLSKPDYDVTKNELLKEIYLYCQSGIHAANLQDHIESHQTKLSNWIDTLDQYS